MMLLTTRNIAPALSAMNDCSFFMRGGLGEGAVGPVLGLDSTVYLRLR